MTAAMRSAKRQEYRESPPPAQRYRESACRNVRHAIHGAQANLHVGTAYGRRYPVDALMLGRRRLRRIGCGTSDTAHLLLGRLTAWVC